MLTVIPCARRVARAAVVTTLLAASMTAFPTAAQAVGVCTRAGTTLGIALGAGDVVTVGIDVSVANKIVVTGGDASCGNPSATPAVFVGDVTTGGGTDLIRVTGTALGNESLTIDFTNGLFEPGHTNEGAAPEDSEIEWDIDLGGGTDSVTVVGRSGIDSFGYGSNGLAFNDDNDADASPFAGVESVTINGAGGNDTIRADGGFGTGNPAGSGATLNGGAGSDTLNGGSGGDTIIGGAGDDIINGNAGSDTASAADLIQGAAGVTASLVTGTSLGHGTDTLSAIENLTGSSLADTLTGSDAANVLSGGPGGDTIDGGAGDDRIDGGTGNDTLIGGDNTTPVNTTTAGDTVEYVSTPMTEANPTLGVTVDLTTAGAQNTGPAGSDTLSGFEHLTGSAFNDTLRGSNAVNRLSGNAGDDTLTGRDDDDSIQGGDGSDTADFSTSTTAITASVQTQRASGAGDDVLVAIENLTGGSGGDTLNGDAAANVLSGLAGDDTLDRKSVV